jgi:MFS family permease
MLGMFIILPVFALYARELPGGDNQTLVGLALGVYGLAQALLQIAFGRLSDRWGRKPTIYLGLVIFAAGSFVAAFAQDIYLVVIGRAIQGAGAISAAVIALAADLTSHENRTKAMAIIGMSIGATFAASMVAGPALGHLIGVPGIFAMTGVLALASVLVVRFVVPDPVDSKALPASSIPLSAVLRDPQLMRLNVGILVLHAILMALFVVLPVMLVEHLPASAQWKVYLPVMVAGVAIMVPAMLISERRGRQKAAFLGAIALVAVQRRDCRGRPELCLAGRRPGAVLRRIQPARGVTAIADIQACAARGEGNRDWRLQHAAVRRHVHRRGHCRRSRAVRGAGGGIRILRDTRRRLVRGGSRHACAAAACDTALSAARDGGGARQRNRARARSRGRRPRSPAVRRRDCLPQSGQPEVRRTECDPSACQRNLRTDWENTNGLG